MRALLGYCVRCAELSLRRMGEAWEYFDFCPIFPAKRREVESVHFFYESSFLAFINLAENSVG